MLQRCVGVGVAVRVRVEVGSEQLNSCNVGVMG